MAKLESEVVVITEATKDDPVNEVSNKNKIETQKI
jgi:hypothetical protein